MEGEENQEGIGFFVCGGGGIVRGFNLPAAVELWPLLSLAWLFSEELPLLSEKLPLLSEKSEPHCSLPEDDCFPRPPRRP